MVWFGSRTSFTFQRILSCERRSYRTTTTLLWLVTPDVTAPRIWSRGHSSGQAYYETSTGTWTAAQPVKKTKHLNYPPQPPFTPILPLPNPGRLSQLTSLDRSPPPMAVMRSWTLSTTSPKWWLQSPHQSPSCPPNSPIYTRQRSSLSLVSRRRLCRTGDHNLWASSCTTSASCSASNKTSRWPTIPRWMHKSRGWTMKLSNTSACMLAITRMTGLIGYLSPNLRWITK